MRNGFWNRGGPKVFGYEPGWLWWAAVLVVLVVGGYLIQDRVRQSRINAEYIDERIVYHAKAAGLDVDLVRAVVEAESGGDWRAESPAGAKGLMQVTPIALKDVRDRFDVGGGDLYNVDYNLEVGTVYLAYLIERFDDIALAVAAYHMGPTAVSTGLKKHPGLAPRELIREIGGPQTRAYVEKVMRLLEAG